MSAVMNRQISMWANEQEELWEAVLSRDAQFDGSFVFAVRSTGIYCRPSCPSRRPRLDRVTFFRLPEAAEQAGFRPCRRCHPRQAKLVDPQVEMVQRACQWLDSTDGERITLAALSEQVGISAFHLQRTFKSVMGITPRQYADACRMERFKARVREGDSITSAMYSAGFGSSSRLYSRAASELGMTPATYSRGGSGAVINYTTARCSLGRLLVAGTERGICAVKLGDSDTALEADLFNEYPAAVIHRSDSGLRESVQHLLDYLEGMRPHLDLSLDIQATAFRWQVWEALRGIPYGKTSSYSNISNSMGRPKAVRAVARACATNPVALVIPCHRVIREDQSFGGYRWGLERKKALLAKESASKQNGKA